MYSSLKHQALLIKIHFYTVFFYDPHFCQDKNILIAIYTHPALSFNDLLTDCFLAFIILLKMIYTEDHNFKFNPMVKLLILPHFC